MLEESYGFSTYSGYDMDGMEYTAGSATFRTGTRILVDFLKVPETPNLAALHLMTVIPGAGKVVGAGVQGAFTMGERAARWVAPRASATLKPLLERTGQLSERVRTSAPKVREYVRDQFNYREHFAAERLRLEAGKKPLRFGQYAEAEDALRVTKPTGVDALEAFGKKPIAKMTDHELMQSLADRAQRSVLGKGPVVGTRRHEYAEDLLRRYQKTTGERPDLLSEIRFADGKKWQSKDPTKGSVIPDVYDTQAGIPYDYKFGKAKVTTDQQMRYQTQLPLKPDGTPTAIVEIKPTLPEV
jgi:hypothetical protein